MSHDLTLTPQLTVFHAGNTFLVRNWEGGIETIPDTQPVDLLWAIAEQLVDLGSRYSAQRLSIGMQPGDKHHDLHQKPCADCECRCDPDRSAE